MREIISGFLTGNSAQDRKNEQDQGLSHLATKNPASLFAGGTFHLHGKEIAPGKVRCAVKCVVSLVGDSEISTPWGTMAEYYCAICTSLTQPVRDQGLLENRTSPKSGGTAILCM